jgi:hypothetical protein
MSEKRTPGFRTLIRVTLPRRLITMPPGHLMAKDKSFSKQFGFSGKDWVALSFSALALTISAGSAYFSIVWQTDNVSLASVARIERQRNPGL